MIRMMLTRTVMMLMRTDVVTSTFFFLPGLSFTDTENSQDSRGSEGTFFYSTLPLPPAHEHSDIYVQLCT